MARSLKAKDLERVYGSLGGHIQPTWDAVARLGIEVIDVRHESVSAAISHEEAAAVGLIYSTPHFGLLRRGQLKAGETALITGAGGGVGSAGVQLDKACGARVIDLAQDDVKAAVARC